MTKYRVIKMNGRYYPQYLYGMDLVAKDTWLYFYVTNHGVKIKFCDRELGIAKEHIRRNKVDIDFSIVWESK